MVSSLSPQSTVISSGALTVDVSAPSAPSSASSPDNLALASMTVLLSSGANSASVLGPDYVVGSLFPSTASPLDLPYTDLNNVSLDTSEGVDYFTPLDRTQPVTMNLSNIGTTNTGHSVNAALSLQSDMDTRIGVVLTAGGLYLLTAHATVAMTITLTDSVTGDPVTMLANGQLNNLNLDPNGATTENPDPGGGTISGLSNLSFQTPPNVGYDPNTNFYQITGPSVDTNLNFFGIIEGSFTVTEHWAGGGLYLQTANTTYSQPVAPAISLTYEKVTAPRLQGSVTLSLASGGNLLQSTTLVGWAGQAYSYSLPSFYSYVTPTPASLTGIFSIGSKPQTVSYAKAIGTTTINYINSWTGRPLFPSRTFNYPIGSWNSAQAPLRGNYKLSSRTLNFEQLSAKQTETFYYTPNPWGGLISYTGSLKTRFGGLTYTSPARATGSVFRFPGYQAPKMNSRSAHGVGTSVSPLSKAPDIRKVGPAAYVAYINSVSGPPIPDSVQAMMDAQASGKTVSTTVYIRTSDGKLKLVKTFVGKAGQQFGVILPKNVNYEEVANSKNQKFITTFGSSNRVIVVDYQPVQAKEAIDIRFDGKIIKKIPITVKWGSTYNFSAEVNKILKELHAKNPYIQFNPGASNLSGRYTSQNGNLNLNFRYPITETTVNVYGTDGNYLTTYKATGEAGTSQTINLPSSIGGYTLGGSSSQKIGFGLKSQTVNATLYNQPVVYTYTYSYTYQPQQPAAQSPSTPFNPDMYFDMYAPKNSGLTPQQAYILSTQHTYNGKLVVLTSMGPLPSNEISLTSVLSGTAAHVPPVTSIGSSLSRIFSSNGFSGIFGQTSNVGLGLAGAGAALTTAAFAVWLSNQKKKNGSSSSNQPVAAGGGNSNGVGPNDKIESISTTYSYGGAQYGAYSLIDKTTNKILAQGGGGWEDELSQYEIGNSGVSDNPYQDAGASKLEGQKGFNVEAINNALNNAGNVTTGGLAGLDAVQTAGEIKESLYTETSTETGRQYLTALNNEIKSKQASENLHMEQMISGESRSGTSAEDFGGN